MAEPSSHPPTGLDVCAACGEPFVAPIGIVRQLEEDRFVVDLSCANCGCTERGVHADAELAALDRRLDDATAQIAAAAEVLALTVELERIDRFAKALEHDQIVPADF